MIRRPPRSTRTDTLFPYTTLFRTDYSFAVGGGDLTLSGGLTYRSKRPNDSVNSPQVTVGALTTFDGSIAYEKGSVELRLWERNLTNKRYIVTANDVTDRKSTRLNSRH